MATKTGYSITGGGGRGYLNIGGWNTTITNKSTTQMEIPGIRRREGANVYIYGLQGTNTLNSAGIQVQFCTALTDGDGTLISPVTFTTVGAAGTAVPNTVRALTVGSAYAQQYGWYFVEGIASVNICTDTATVTLGSPICVSSSSSNKWVGTCTSTGQGFALTAIACDITGPAFIKLM